MNRIYEFARRAFFLLLCVVFLTVVYGTTALDARAQASGYDVIAAVNQLRVASGLPPFQVNGALMAAARAHSEYMAATGAVTHAGAGGSRASDRAVAAGFGGGAKVFVSENIAAGYDWTAQDAVQIWQGDSLHLDTMLSPNYTDAGAGVAVAGHTVYFTLDVGYTEGAPGSGVSPDQGPRDITVYPQFTPVDTATPQPDGSILHVVQDGQALWNIAAIYGIETDELLALNQLTENSIIFPGDTLVVRSPADTPTATPPATITPFPATATGTATSTITPPSPLEIAVTETAYTNFIASQTPPASLVSTAMSSGRDLILPAIGMLVIGGLALLLVGSVLNRFG